MEDVIVVSNRNDQRILMGFMRAAMTIAFSHRMNSEEINQKTLKINKYLYQILGSLLENGRAGASSIQKRIQTALDGDPIFDPEFNPCLFQECFFATQQALEDICLQPSPIS